MLELGSTGAVERVSPGVVLKTPHIVCGRLTVDDRRKNYFFTEQQILQRLGNHARIVKFLETQGVNGFGILDASFYGPLFNWKSSTLLDLFGLGSVMYTILTGRWPYKDTPGQFEDIHERFEWEKSVYPCFQREEFPDVDAVPLGKAILGWALGEPVATI